MNLVGPVEFSAVEIIGALVVLAVFWVILPSVGGILAVRRYRRTRADEDQTSTGVAVSFVTGVVIVYVAVGFLAWLTEQLVP